jgi:hypothetical protein
MDHRAVEDRGRGLVACGGFRPVLVDFSYRLDRFPRQIPESRQGPLDIGNLRLAVNLPNLQSFQDGSREQAAPDSLARGRLAATAKLLIAALTTACPAEVTRLYRFSFLA